MAGEAVGVVGPNASDKSTLARAITGGLWLRAGRETAELLRARRHRGVYCHPKQQSPGGLFYYRRPCTWPGLRAYVGL
ncbi:hypothetical protein [Rhizobium leguminosarum]|uniref:hypothetical protein n=1 Tax=Rhizobium leguminosarum TaxID=384 RepID=UPI0021B0BD92|nr:hypothetical protein [Rhizobium leguminosarum]